MSTAPVPKPPKLSDRDLDLDLDLEHLAREFRPQAPQRQIRLPDEDYFGSVAKAKAEGLRLSDVIRRLLKAWREGDIELPS